MHAQVQETREGHHPPHRRSISTVLADVLGNLQDILSAEIHLARAQTREDLRGVQSAATLITLGVLAGLLAGFFLLFAAVAALSLVITLWLAALLVGLGMAVLCAVTLQLGSKRMKSRTALAAARIERTVEEQTQWTGRPKT